MMRRGRKADTMKSVVARTRAAEDRALRSASLCIALVLISIAIVFFLGAILAQYSGAPTVGIGVVGSAILGFLVIAMGRNVRK